MAIYITLAKFTDTGIKSIKDSPKRAQAFRDMAQKKGVKVLSTIGAMVGTTSWRSWKARMKPWRQWG